MLIAEFLKIWKKRSVKIILFCVMICTILYGGIECAVGENATIENWRQEAQKNLDNKEKELSKMLEKEGDSQEDIDFWNEIYGEDIAVYKYALEHDIPVGVGSAWSSVYNSTVLINLITIFMLAIAIGNIINEYTYGTIKLALTNSHKRSYVLFTKKLSLTLFTMLLFAVQFISSFFVGLICFRSEYGRTLQYQDGVVSEVNMITSVLLTYMIRFMLTLILTWVAMGIAIIFKNTAVSILGTLFIWLGDLILGGFLGEKSWYPYTPFPNLKTSIYINNGTLCSVNKTMLQSFGVLMFYLVVFTFITRWFFCKKDVTNM